MWEFPHARYYFMEKKNDQNNTKIMRIFLKNYLTKEAHCHFLTSKKIKKSLMPQNYNAIRHILKDIQNAKNCWADNFNKILINFNSSNLRHILNYLDFIWSLHFLRFNFINKIKHDDNCSIRINTNAKPDKHKLRLHN